LRLSYPRGFSLLELLIATFVLSFGLLGIVGVHIHSFQRVENIFWQTLAVAQLISMKEELQVTDKQCSVSNAECKRLLPQGECKCNHNAVHICWRKLQNKQCLDL